MPAPSICDRRLPVCSEICRDGMYSILTGREEVNLTPTFFLDDLFLQVLDGLGMSPVE